MREIGFFTPVVVGNWTLSEVRKQQIKTTYYTSSDSNIECVKKVSRQAVFRDLVDDYFYNPLWSEKKVQIIHNVWDMNTYEVEELEHSPLTFKGFLWTAFKTATMLTLIVPAAILVAKFKYRLWDEPKFLLLSFPHELAKLGNHKGFTEKNWKKLEPHERTIYFMKVNQLVVETGEAWKQNYQSCYNGLDILELMKKVSRTGGLDCSLLEDDDFMADFTTNSK